MSQFYNEEDTATAVKKLISKKLYQLAKISLRDGLLAMPESRKLRFLQAFIASETNDYNTAAHLYESILADDPDREELLLFGAQAWGQAGHAEKGLEYAKRYLGVSNNNIDGYFVMADIYERNNRIEEAEGVMSKFPATKSTMTKWVHLQTRILLAKKQYEEVIEFILKHRDNLDSTHIGLNKVGISFLLCKAYDRIGEYDMAWEAAQFAHKHDDTPFDPKAFFSQFEDIQEFMSDEVFEALAEGPRTEIEPLFIIGSPRSGTSLLEQILSMHTDIENGGEMSVGMNMQIDVSTITDSFHSWPLNLIDIGAPEAEVLSDQYFEAVSYCRNNEKVISNKALNLPTQVGFLSKIIPSSRAIILHRHPLDNAVSCFTTNLVGSGHLYTSSLDSLGKTWVVRRVLADLWIERLSIPVMELHYESLVANQREETQRIINFLDLPWQEECMEFHTSKYVARTISYDQVNKKMYTTSDGRWRNYEKHLGPLIDIVSDYI